MSTRAQQGAKGGRSRSEAKVRAAQNNLIKAREGARRRRAERAQASPPTPTPGRNTAAYRASKSELMTSIMRRRLREEPERVTAISSANGTTACSYVYRCDECRRVFNGPSVHWHQQRRGHVGLTVLGTPHNDT